MKRLRAAGGERVDGALARMDEPAAADEGRAFVNGKRVAGDRVLEADEELVVHAARARLDAGVVILARAGGLVVIDKPASLATTPDRRGGSSAIDAAAALLRCASSRLHPASRLDVGVSGALILATDPASAKAIAEAKAQGEVERLYVAIASGHVEGEGTWDAPIGTKKHAGRSIPAAHGHAAEPATTRYRALAHAGQATLLALAPVTGRTHQLRVHAAHANAPLFGDREHGGPQRVVTPSGRVVAFRDRVALHARSVAAPSLGVAAESPIPDALRALWAALGGDDAAWDA